MKFFQREVKEFEGAEKSKIFGMLRKTFGFSGTPEISKKFPSASKIKNFEGGKNES